MENGNTQKKFRTRARGAELYGVLLIAAIRKETIATVLTLNQRKINEIASTLSNERISPSSEVTVSLPSKMTTGTAVFSG